MQLKNTVEHSPVLSNVGSVSAFTIKATSKSFQILSSGLYANKIRAVIREYSCNAVDSHVAAGKADVPFDVHLPSTLEPWFSVRDYGVGLSEEEVTNIYTSFFESTKTGSDDYIGALGLGSKSAFSYTENFTIVAIKNGVKRVFTAFINENGVPSIAPMGEENTTDPNGVEIRFAVEDSYDFRKFYEEARHVYKHFKLRPVVSGADFSFIDPEYEDRDIIPGVHSNNNRHSRSIAIMGNIEYPIYVPNNADLGGLENLLDCGLVMEFGIGELDIQASREGLSYIPETIAAIKNKLKALNTVLADRVAEEANKIKNGWDRALFLNKKGNSQLWAAAVIKYVTDTKFKLYEKQRYGYEVKSFILEDKVLSEKLNINLSVFYIDYSYYGHEVKASNIKSRQHYVDGAYVHGQSIEVNDNINFVVNDTNVGATERAKYHYKSIGGKNKGGRDYIYVLNKADKTKEMNVKGFFKLISNPPKRQIVNASTLSEKPRAAGIGRNVSILKLERRNNLHHMNSQDMVWRDAGDIKTFDDSKTYYYMPLNGFQCAGAGKAYDMKTFAKAIKDSGIVTDTVYGVRKNDLDQIKAKSNWVELDTFVKDKLTQQGTVDTMGIIKEAIGYKDFYKDTYIVSKINTNSPFLKLYNEFKDVKAVDQYTKQAFEKLCLIYNVNSGNVNVTDTITKYKNEMKEINKRYPLLSQVGRWYVDTGDIADYINGIDLIKGI